MTGSTGGVTSDLPAVRRRACSRAVCHRVDRVADIEMRGVRKVKGGTGDACRIISAFVAHLIRAPMCRCADVPIQSGRAFEQLCSRIVDPVHLPKSDWLIRLTRPVPLQQGKRLPEPSSQYRFAAGPGSFPASCL